ncbi:MAG: long-chain fatty acid--CoA ligase [Pseudomonadota bacterium]
MLILADNLGSVTDQATGTRWQGEKIASEARERCLALSEGGIGPGDTVALWQGGSGAFFADLLAAWSAGAAVAVLNPGLTADEVDAVIGHVRAKLVLVDGDLDRARAMSSIPVVDFGASVGPDPAPRTDRRATLDDPALMLFTSGTTGTPKGVVHTFRSLVARLALNETFIGRDDFRRTLCTLPTHFGHGLIGNSLTPLLHGGDVTLIAGSDARAVMQLGAVIDEHAITFMSSVPALWKMALKMSKPPSGGSLRRVHVGSAPLSADLWSKIIEWCGTRNVVNMYGITETANWIGGASAAAFEPQDGLVGRMWGGQAGVLKDDGSIAAEGDGEIVVQAPSLMAGYFELDDLTAAVLKDGWFHTGDIGHVEGGVVRLTGREKYEINRAGMKVHPEDIDLLLERHDGVVEACAFGAPDPIVGEMVCVAVVIDQGHAIDDIKSWCRERLVREKNPEKWFVLDAIPKTDRGKINRNVVAEACFASD